jgi:hypothetical protein
MNQHPIQGECHLMLQKPGYDSAPMSHWLEQKAQQIFYLNAKADFV